MYAELGFCLTDHIRSDKCETSIIKFMKLLFLVKC